MSHRFTSFCLITVISSLMTVSGSARAVPSSPKFIPTFAIYYNIQTPLNPEEAAKFDLIDTDRFQYDRTNDNTWSAIKKINFRTQIYLYEMGPETTNIQDDLLKYPAYYLNTIARYKAPRVPPEGSLFYDYPQLFLNDENGNPTYNTQYSKPEEESMFYLMDFGDKAYQKFWAQSVKADITDQEWRADGIFVDNCLALNKDKTYGTKDTQEVYRPPIKYPTNQEWSDAMNDFTYTINRKLGLQRQKTWCNRGGTRDQEAYDAWKKLDEMSLNRGLPGPDLLMEEGAFAVSWWGDGVETQFYPEKEWRRQVDMLGAIKSSGLTYLSHTKLEPSDTAIGIDNYGNSVKFYQTLWYALGSFLLGRDESLRNAYFSFVSDASGYGYRKIQWFPEYEKIDLGKALGTYTFTNITSKNLYWREFEKGWVIVNPTQYPIDNINQFGSVRVLTHDTLNTAPSDIPTVTSVSLRGHHSVILLRP